MSRTFDWDEIARRLARSQSAADPDAADTEERNRVLQARAAALARPAPELVDSASADQFEVLVFEVAGERYAVANTWVARALPMPALTALPGTPNHVVGIVPYGGRVLAVLDLRSLLALPLSRLVEPTGLVLLQGAAVEFALLADAIAGVRRYRLADLGPEPERLGRMRPGYLLGVTPDRTAVLDAEKLLNDPALVVQAGA
ncbi:chemotaxis protein CheW [Massilia horti]|nr:chemotaxis protein CheW [Massilia horti]